MANFDTLIFTIDDVRAVRKVSVNIDDFDMFAVEVQRNYLTKLLGDKLYTALLTDLVAGVPQTAKYTDLVGGKIYTDGEDIIFRGIKLYCVYLWLYMYMSQGGVEHTPIGTVLFKDEQVERDERNGNFKNAQAHYMAAADGMEEGILNYLRKYATTYPEFSESPQIEQAQTDNMTFKVIGKKYTSPNSLW